MKFGQFKRVLKEDLAKAGDELPKWIDVLLSPINLLIEQVAKALQNQLTFEDNFKAKEITLNFTSGVPIEINPTTSFAPTARAFGVLLLNSYGKAVISLVWENKNNGNVSVTINFTSAADGKCVLLILLR